ncbi:MAG: hypothetical protein HY288_01125 [Planctomycetia bacterium]|nr:hypothetical protein [Planctomycetia bacterium]
MDTLLESAARILEIESRQDAALKQLAELEERLERVLAEWLPSPAQAACDAARLAPPPAAASSAIKAP